MISGFYPPRQLKNPVKIKKEEKMSIEEEKNAPWLKSYGEVKFHIDYPKGSMSDVVLSTADRYPNQTALSCMGTKIPYKLMKRKIMQTARAFAALGIKKGDKVTICMPNLPQTVYSLYALNYIGAVVSLIHPLSALGEIAYYLSEVDSHIILTLDSFYSKMLSVQKQYPIDKIILTGAAEELGFMKKWAYKLIKGKKDRDYTVDENVVYWEEFIKEGKNVKAPAAAHLGEDELSVILFSGGTTGVTKGIMLSSKNFNALALQTATMCNRRIQGKKMLAAMPCFHGFGLGVCVHTMMVLGGESILVPKFNVKDYALLIKKNKPNYIAGVPTLYEALTRNNYLDGVNLSCLMGVFSGGDSLSVELKKKFDAFLSEHGATVRVREGYGTTECVTASCLTPYNKEKEGSIGLPYPDTYYKICKVGTTEEVPYGEEGEICLSGPTVMLGYYNRPDENANTLKKHADGKIWLHTGDLGMMDDEGFIFFKQRIKRMIITSGYNVYPSQIENIIDGHEAVQMSCVIGVKDEYKMQRVKAFITLKPGYEPNAATKKSILNYCRTRIAKYALPYDIEFRNELPKTLVGKIAYTVLEKEENEKITASQATANA